jgi:acid phosphatase type 7
VTQRTATVAWVVETDQATLHPPTGDAKISPSLHVEKTTFTGLQPNTQYTFEAGPDHSPGSFKTPPPAGEPFRFVVYGDTRTRAEVHRAVMKELLKHGVPDFIAFSGDSIADGTDSSLWPIFFDIERDLLRQTAFFPALGNHDRHSPYWFDYLQQAKPYYSFNWGSAHFTVLDSDLGSVSQSKSTRDTYWAEQCRWLEEDLAGNQKADFRFVMAHHPPYTAVKSRQGDDAYMKALVPMLEKYHVSAGLFGHDHNYQHFLKNGINYITSGGGGAPLYDVDVPPAEITQKVMSIENFVSISVNGKVAKVEAIAVDGRAIDEFEIK